MELTKTNDQLYYDLVRHEAICQERWLEILHRVKRLETIMVASAGSIIVLLAGLLWKSAGL